jgi:hypothetical protein
MPTLDLSSLTPAQVAVFTVAIAIADFIFSSVAAAAKHTFNWGYVAAWIDSHGVHRILPIVTFLVIGHGFADVLPAMPALWFAGIAFLVTYAGETLASIYGSFTAVKPEPPTDQSALVALPTNP